MAVMAAAMPAAAASRNGRLMGSIAKVTSRYLAINAH